MSDVMSHDEAIVAVVSYLVTYCLFKYGELFDVYTFINTPFPMTAWCW